MAESPFVSVVIPTRARPALLRRCVAALAEQRYPRQDFEVVVADDGGALAPDTLAEFRDRLDVCVVAQPHAGPSAARNLGARRARGELLAFTDDDCEPDPGWVAALAAHALAVPNAAVAGRVVNALPSNLYSTASQLLVDYLGRYYNHRPDAAAFATSNNLAFPAGLYHQCGGFDEAFPLAAAEDRDLCDRWRARGLRVIFAPEAVVAHAHALDPRSFWQQHFNYGRGAVLFHQARQRRGGGPVRVEPAAFYRRLVLEPFAHERPRRAAMLAGLLLLSQVAHAAGYLSGLGPAGGRRERAAAGPVARADRRAQGTGSGTA